MVPNKRALSINVRMLRVDRGWSQKDLAAKAGLSRSAVARLELGGPDPERSTVAAIAAALGVEPYALHVERHSGWTRPVLIKFLQSPWLSAIKPTAEERMWLESLPEIVYWGSPPTAETVAQLILWRRHVQAQAKPQPEDPK
jgi:transcriptional regulator with XRE-family HTH domain